MSNLMVALSLATAGVHVFPCAGTDGDDGKRPLVAWRGESSTDADKIGRWFAQWPGATVAIDVGKSGLFVVDCDRPKADGQRPGVEWFEELISANNADTFPFVTSRTPSGGVHYIFRQPSGDPLRNSRGGLPKKAEVAIDVRGMGGYILAPGAKMQDGRAYILNGDINDIPAVPDWLLAILRKPEAHPNHVPPLPVIVLPPSPGRVSAYSSAGFESEIAEVRHAGKGTRNETLNTSAFKIGTMVGAGWVSEAEAYSALVGAISGWDNQHKTLDTLRRALREGMGKPREGLPDEIGVDPAAMVAPLLARTAGGELYNTSTGEIVEPAPISADSEIPYPAGLVGEIAKWIVAASRRPQPLLAIGAALCIVGTAVGRKVAGPTLSGTHLYVVALAPTGSGKDRPLSACKRVLAACGFEREIGGSEFISMPAVINAVKKNPCSLWAVDEFGSFFSRINSRRASGFEQAITGMLRKLWGSSFERVQTPEWAGRPAEKIEAPALSIFGASTPEEFYEALEGSDIRNGVLNRLLVLSVDERPTDREPLADHREVPGIIVEQLKRLYNGPKGELAAISQNTGDMVAEPYRLGWGEGAEGAFAALVREVEDRGAGAPMQEPFIARVAEYAIRLATIVAIGRGSHAVERGDMDFGRALAWRSARDVMAGSDGYMAESDNQVNANMILRALRAGPQAGMSVGLITRALRNRLRVKDQRDLLAQMVESGQVVQDRDAGLYRTGA